MEPNKNKSTEKNWGKGQREEWVVIYEITELFQVEAALTADAENSELLTLKADLEQVIGLTEELIAAQAGEISTKSESNKCGEFDKLNSEESGIEYNESTQLNNQDLNKYEDLPVQTLRQPVKHWQVGEECQALSHKDGQ